MRISTRWGLPATCFPTSSRSASARSCSGCATRSRTPRISGSRPPAGAASTTSRRSCSYLRRSAAARLTTRCGWASCCSTPSGAPPVTCRRSRPVQARTRCSTARRSRCTRTCSCTLSAPVTASGRRRPRRTRFARPRCGGCGSGVPCYTTAARRPSPTPSGPMAPRPISPGRGSTTSTRRPASPCCLPRLALKIDLRP